MAVISDSNAVKQDFLLAGDIVSLLTSLLGLPLVSVFVYQRLDWQLKLPARKRFTVASVSLLISYVAVFFFILTVTLLLHIRAGQRQGLCEATLLICLTLYIVTKVTNIIFLIERLYIISWPVNSRHRTPEYVATSLVVFVPYAVAVALCFKYRIAFYVGKDVCIIGIKFYGLIPLILVEVLAYLYLTLRFLYPLIMVHFGGTGLLLPLRRVVWRTFIGTGITTVSTLAVKVSLTLFNGEPAWLCCMICKIDAVIAAMCLHLMSKPDARSEEHGSLQALGIGFESSPTHQNSQSTCRTDWTREFGMKETF